jgi:hypothetical protein
MKIEENQIAQKEIVGKTGDGEPVVMILTHGGLYAFFSKKDKTIESLGMAPHRAIAAWMAEKKDPSIKWKDGFLKSETNKLEELKKSQESQFQRFRKILFSPVLLVKNEPNVNYLIYDTDNVTIGIMHKDDIKAGIKAGEIGGLCMVRNLNLNEPVQLVERHKEFK